MYNRLRELREDRDLNQTQVAKYLNMSQTGYSKYETGENDVPTKILIELAKFYNTSIDYLLELTNEIKPYERLKQQQSTNFTLNQQIAFILPYFQVTFLFFNKIYCNYILYDS